MLRQHGRVLVESKGDDGAYATLRVLRNTRSMLQVCGCGKVWVWGVGVGTSVVWACMRGVGWCGVNG
jgi:hypothetical protein